MQRAVALLFATLLVLGAVAQLLVGLFAMTFCIDNCDGPRSPGEPSDTVIALTVGAAVVVIVVCIAFWCFVAFDRPVAATVDLLVQLGVAFALLRFWLDQSNSDGIILRWFACFQLCGFIALALFLTKGERPPPDAA